MPADKPDQPGSPDIRIADHEFRRFRDFLYRRTGIVFGDAQRAYVERRLADRILAAGAAKAQATGIVRQALVLLGATGKSECGDEGQYDPAHWYAAICAAHGRLLRI